MSRRSHRRRRRGLPVAFKVGASLFVLACFLAMLEGGARIVAPLAPAWQGEDNGGVVMTGHPTRLWGMGSGVRTNGGTTATISAIGLREPMPQLPRPEGRQRVLILGDSTFFGHGVSDDQTLGAQLQAGLARRGVDADVVNGAIPGYSTEQSLMLLDEVGWDLEPTLLVIGNLWSDNNFDLFEDRDLLHTRVSLGTGLAAKSAFMRLLAGWIDGFRSDSKARVVTWTRTSAFPKTGVRRVGLQDYASNLDRMIRQAAAHGVGVVLLAPSNRDTVDQGRSDDQAWATYFAAQQRLSDCHQLPWADTLPALQAAVAQGAAMDQLFIDEMHPSTRGHGLIASAIMDALLAAGWPEAPLIGGAEPCPMDDLQDPFPGGRSTTVNQLSPQSNLYPNAGASMGPQAATVPEGQRLPPGAWVVSGSVTSHSWPVQVSLRDVEGRPLASTLLESPGPALRLDVTNGLDRVEVFATSADGSTASVVATPEQAQVALELTAATP